MYKSLSSLSCAFILMPIFVLISFTCSGYDDWGVRGGVLLPVCAKLRSYTQVPDDYSSFIMGMTSDPETLIHPLAALLLLSVKREIPTLVPSHLLAWPPSDMCWSKVFGTSSTGLRVQLAVPSVAALVQASLRLWCWSWCMLRFA